MHPDDVDGNRPHVRLVIYGGQEGSRALLGQLTCTREEAQALTERLRGFA